MYIYYTHIDLGYTVQYDVMIDLYY